MPRRLIRDIIADRPLITVSRNESVRAAAILMAEKRVGALLVVEGRRIAGIFTERDALNKVLAGRLDPDATSVGQVMVGDPQTIRADKPLGYALHLMAEGGFRHVPVVEDGKPIGMVSARNALGLEIHQFEQELVERDHIAEIL